MKVRNDATHPAPMREPSAISTHRKHWLVLALILQGCADVPVEPPRIERISAEQLEARLPPPPATVPLEQIVTLARQGSTAADIIARIKDSGSRYRLSATQLVDLARQGVPLAVLDHLVASERRQIFEDMAADANIREMACQERLAREAEFCRRQTESLPWYPRQQPFMNCFPPLPGSIYWRCL